MTDYTDYSATPADNTSPPPVGAPEGMYPSAVNDTMREMMSVVRQLGDQTAVTFGTFGSMALQASNNVHITGGTIVTATFGAHNAYINTLEVDLLIGSTSAVVNVPTFGAHNAFINTLEVDLLVYSGATLSVETRLQSLEERVVRLEGLLVKGA